MDLSRLRKVTVDPDKRLAYAQGGALWADFNAATMAHGLATPGGIISHTGIGGVIVGGGQGYLTGQHGLCIDNLVEVTMVVADGRIVKANDNENADLFWAVRGAAKVILFYSNALGGGSNFGVVYEFVVRLHPHQTNVFGGFIAFTVDKIPQIVQVSRELTENFRPDMALIIGVGAPEKDVIFITP